jgi:hypothetical protein
VSPSPNSSHTGWSPIEMPDQRSHDLSHRRRTGIMGPDTRQRAALDWTPLSLHNIRERLWVLPGSLPLTRARYKLAARTSPAHAFLLSGTVRGNVCVSRTWEQLRLPHPPGARAFALRPARRQSLNRCLVQSPLYTTRTKRSRRTESS